jgi:hypothetical protein
LVVEKGVGVCYHFGKTTPSFPYGQPKRFGCHLMVWVCPMAIEILWSPFDGGGMLDSDQFFSITIPQTPLFDDDHFFSKGWN